MEESGVQSLSASVDISLITEANPIDIHHVGTYPILLERWEGAERCPINRTGIGRLAVEESGV